MFTDPICLFLRFRDGADRGFALGHASERIGRQPAKPPSVNRLREHQERLIGAILLGNNLTNILASSLATSLMIAAFGETGVVYATTLMTLLVLIFSEILPKTYALKPGR